MQNLALNENKASVFNFQKIKNKKKKKKKAATILDKIFIEFFFALIHLFSRIFSTLIFHSVVGFQQQQIY